MKLIVLIQSLVIGGSQLNAIELAAALRDLHGYEVLLVSGGGPMEELVAARNLRHIRISWDTPFLQFLGGLAKREKPDVLYAWDPVNLAQPAYYGGYLVIGIPVVNASMEMTLTEDMPLDAISTFGTPYLAEQAKKAGFTNSYALLPPVDVHWNKPSSVDAQPFRRQYNVRDDTITAVTVSRLARDLKGESLLASVEAIGLLARHKPLRLLIVGDGPEMGKLQSRADSINLELGREAITLTGAMLDPRPAYEAADFAIGMGGSALRSMAFEKPTIIVGEKGFASAFTPDTSEWFLRHGMFGIGHKEHSISGLMGEIDRLIEAKDQFAQLGKFSRDVVVEYFSLETAAAKLDAILQQAVQRRGRIPSRARLLMTGDARRWWARRITSGVRRRMSSRSVE